MTYYLFNFTRKGAAKGRTLRDQAADLLNIRLWGIGLKTANRDALGSGDDVLLYVGAPESAFIGHARLAQGVHTWTEEEARRYPGDMGSGVSFEQASLWDHPVRIQSVLAEMELRETNPRAQFFGGVVRITKTDFETVLTTAGVLGEVPARPPVEAERPVEPPGRPLEESPADRVFEVTETLKQLVSTAPPLSEYDTRALLIDKYLNALGYVGLEDVQRGSPVEAGTFPDYVLRVHGQPAIGLEAKKLGAPLGPKEAAQAVAYCSNLGVRWAALTDGRFFMVYDAPMLGVLPHERLVLTVDLADYKDREDFDARVWPRLELVAKSQLEAEMGLKRWVAREAAREILSTTNSRPLRALRKELDEKGIRLSLADLDGIMEELLG